MTYLEKAEQVSEEDRERIKNKLYSIASELRKNYDMKADEIRRFIIEMLTLTV